NDRRKGARGMSRAYEIALHPEVLPFIKERVEKDFPEQFLFLNPRNGKPYSWQTVRKIWNKARDQAAIQCGLYGATRHSVGTLLARAGVSSLIISKQLGHSTAKMSEKYIHGDLELVRGNLVYIGLKKKSTEKESVAEV